MTYRPPATVTVYVAKKTSGPDGGCDGYAFQDEVHANRWIAQPYLKGHYEVVAVEAARSRRACGCCGALHWWMTWRGRRIRVRGAFRPPAAFGEAGTTDDDGQE